VHTWSIVLPQIVEGVATVLVLHRAVRRLAGPRAGLLAALVLALSPAVVALDRGNISDSLMILLVVLAADAVAGAVRDGRLWRIVLAGIWVGLAFQAKMVEAWLVLPALAAAYLASGPGGIGPPPDLPGSATKRLRHCSTVLPSPCFPPTNPQAGQRLPAAGRDVGQPPHVPAVHTPGQRPAPGTGHRPGPNTDIEPHHQSRGRTPSMHRPARCGERFKITTPRNMT
jgi:hypothetical protein